jgi:hypothetical protein
MLDERNRASLGSENTWHIITQEFDKMELEGKMQKTAQKGGLFLLAETCFGAAARAAVHNANAVPHFRRRSREYRSTT